MSPYIVDQKRSSSAIGFKNQVMMSNVRGSVREKKNKTSLQNSSSTLPLKGVGFEDLRKTDHTLPKSKQKFVWKKSKKPKQSSNSSETADKTTTSNKDSNLYDLYAVCNHHGNMDSGHYISHCCNPIDGRWYTYDDHKVFPLTNTDQLITQYAYVLFYLRRGAKVRYSLSSSDINDDHWIKKLIHFKIDLTKYIPPTDISSPQRQGSVPSAKTISMDSGVSLSDNMTTITSPPGHTHFLSSPDHTHILQNLPSPSAHSNISYFSQSSSQPFTKRVGSYHGNSTNRTTTRL